MNVFGITSVHMFANQKNVYCKSLLTGAIIDDGKEMMYIVSTDVLLSVLNFLLLNTQGGRNKFILSEAKNSYFLH